MSKIQVKTPTLKTYSLLVQETVLLLLLMETKLVLTLDLFVDWNYQTMKNGDKIALDFGFICWLKLSNNEEGEEIRVLMENPVDILQKI